MAAHMDMHAETMTHNDRRAGAIEQEDGAGVV